MKRTAHPARPGSGQFVSGARPRRRPGEGLCLHVQRQCWWVDRYWVVAEPAMRDRPGPSPISDVGVMTKQKTSSLSKSGTHRDALPTTKLADIPVCDWPRSSMRGHEIVNENFYAGPYATYWWANPTSLDKGREPEAGIEVDRVGTRSHIFDCGPPDLDPHKISHPEKGGYA